MNTKTTPKDFFLHLGATIALYVSAGALINLSFAIINYYFPDQLAGYFYASSIAWPISILMVLVPTLYLLEWLINKDVSKIPEKLELWIRKWRLYLTIFLAIALIGGDLISLISTYLNGEISARFIYKIITILLIGGVVGKYYFFSIYTDIKWSKMIRRVNTWFGIILVLTAIIFGFIAVGSPTTQRGLRFDQQKINDLTNIQYQIVDSWQRSNKLPNTLDALNDPVYGMIVPVDPETKASYEYRIKMESPKSPLTFELCATFDLESRDYDGRGDYGMGGGGTYGLSKDEIGYYPIVESGDIWKHGAGHQCFERSIDPAKHSPFPVPTTPI